ncbi:hypothetical protein StoSoilB22_41380 [Arthrobacter sp. StoSoilB22]|nr:hypothetical protein StoSoilB22_41380 [Arthrobacter sp. StoSoilB22]
MDAAILSGLRDIVRCTRRTLGHALRFTGRQGVQLYSGTQMEDGFVSNALGLNRGLTRFGLEPETSPGHPR